MGLRDRLNKRPEQPTGSFQTSATQQTRPVMQLPGASTDSYHELKHELHQKLIEKIDLQTIEKLPREQLRDELRLILNQLLALSDLPLNRVEREQMVEELLDEVTGLGPLEPLLADTTISDIMVNGYSHLLHRALRQARADADPLPRQRAPAADHRPHRVARRPPHRRVVADGRRPSARRRPRQRDHSRRWRIDGPVLSIRRFGGSPLRVKDMVAINSATPGDAGVPGGVREGEAQLPGVGRYRHRQDDDAQRAVVVHPENERVLTIEDAAELQLQQKHVVRLETRPPNIEGKGEVIARDLVKNALRMRPDRIIIGECRGGEVLDMLQAMNTGHEGSMTTVHANTPRDALSRVEAMVGMGGIQMSEMLIRQTIARSLNVIVQLSRGTDGKRRITSISEITDIQSA
jgi:pilus assembly protein CpaF